MPYLFVALYLAGVASGALPAWRITQSYYQAQELELVKAALNEQQKRLQAAYDAEKKAVEANHQEELRSNVIVREIVKTIPKIQRVRSECNYTVGTVRLLNDAAAADVPKTASVPAEADSAGSDVTGERGIKYSLELLRAYNLARNQCNSLIGFVAR
jgi:hypothetical protein